MRILLVSAVVLVVTLAGCTAGPEPGLPRGQLPVDIDAPLPEPVDEPPELIEPEDPGEPFTVFGLVLGPNRLPVAGAAVWIEGADLRQPVNNVAVYEAMRDATRTVTDAQGRYAFRLEGGFYHVIAEKPGFLPRRSEPALAEDRPTRLDIRLVADDATKAMAHRGASYYAPENTVVALRKAALLGAQTVEVDVQLTKDNEPIVFHDFSLDRTTNGTGSVRATPWAEIQALDAGAWFHESFRGERVVTLAEMLAAGREQNVTVIVDVKAGREWATLTYQVVLNTIAGAGAQDFAVFASFEPEGVTACGDRGGFRCALISRGPGPGEQVVAEAAAMGATSVLLRHTLVDAGVVDAARSVGLRVYVWTLNEEEEWETHVGLAVDGILTDRPGYLIDYLSARAFS